MFDETEKKLQLIERMVEAAYFAGFDYDEDKGPPRFAAKVLVNELRNAIINEMVSARLMSLSD